MYLTHEKDGIALVMQTQEEIDFIAAILGGMALWKSPIDIDVKQVSDVCSDLMDFYSTLDSHQSPIFKQVPEFVSKQEWEC